MCMMIDSKIRIPKVNKNGFCIGYKVLQVNNHSYYKGYPYILGENYADRDSISLTENEIETGEVIDGFHLFISLKEAKASLGYKIYPCKIIRVYFKLDDVVSTGTRMGREKNAVVTKLTVFSLKAIAEKRSNS